MPTTTTLVLLPGLDGSEILFRPFVRALPPEIRVTVVEYPPDSPGDYDSLIGIVRAACVDLGEFFILGWSFGGPLALRLAAERPPGLLGVILVASFVRAPWPILRVFAFAAVSPIARLFPLVSRALALCGGYATGDLRRDRAASWNNVSPRALAARARAALGVDARSDLERITAPVFYLASTNDVVVPRSNVRAILRLLPTLRVATITGPHLALRTNAPAAAAAVAAFIGAGTPHSQAPDA